ncbi:MAG TPA: hypothetical protein VM557_09160 [Thermoanaerobaculia bacterium]|nr:hypothetical protein [Thermoanaerobaculia bacterium]
MHVEILVPIALFAMTAFIVWALVRAGVSRSQHRLEAHSRMLDRFGSSQEFVTFLQTPEGKRYLDSVALGSQKTQKVKILGSIRTGVVLSVISIGLMAAAFLVGSTVSEPPFIFGFLGLFLGVGFLASAAVSWSVSKAWGILDDPRRNDL